ncbi:GATA-type domain-containing protein [Mycena indigotica]|uniref:GATA-type domain-containing protein n=1 Tax=Mycena indigotica TaxID=2126181 RepID=A0A8H6SNT3_9AGAR|nr:GATA-type domain-containing protein [Mycena indigotica]KAF7302265.1 GATA-type domain-containing protein [Mycena indigotica]
MEFDAPSHSHGARPGTASSSHNSDSGSPSPRTPSPPLPLPLAAGGKGGQGQQQVHVFGGGEEDERRPSLLQELYDEPVPAPHQHGQQHQHHYADWTSPASPPLPHQQQQQGHSQQGQGKEYTMVRRATLPYSRQEYAHQHPQYLPHPQQQHPQYDMPMSAEPAALHGHGGQFYDGAYDGYYHQQQQRLQQQQQQQQMAYQMQHLPHHPSHLPPSHHPHLPPPHAHAHMGPLAYAAHAHAIQVQHTDDAASKETQYLRRRCFNCHTTEPPSWRRSTLNPGKIVCNKCGLYERTHLRPRPLRFDELRAGNKARKGGAAGGGVAKREGGSPKQPASSPKGRRGSVGSNGSGTQSSGASDWDDAASVYSASTPSTSFNSPHPPPLALASPGRSSASRSPPLLSSPPHSAGLALGIRLPHAPEIPGLRTKPRSNTTGGVGMGYGAGSPAHLGASPHAGYASPPGHVLHHVGSSGSLHDEVLSGAGAGELYRRTSMPDMHAGPGTAWEDGGYGGYGMGMVSVKEEPRSVLV